jgi:probable F420-dependent oxidoreductase
VEIGVFAPLANPAATPEYMHALGTACEERGIASIWVAEHVVLFDEGEYGSKYPYSEDGRFPAGPGIGILEPFNALSFLAACTKTVRLGTGIVLVPQRNPVYTAKEAATVDWMSNGRLDFGIGIGWLKEEFDVLGVPFDGRGARCREYIDVIKSLWCDPQSQYEGEFYRLRSCRQFPKPLQTPHPPIHVGGESDPALKRVADFAQGWYGYNLDPAGARAHVAKLDKLLRERGRKLADVKISICPYLRPVAYDDAEQYCEAGVDQIIVFLFASDADGLRRTLDELSENLVEPARALQP